MLFIQNYPYVFSVQWKKLCSCILKISVDHLPLVWKKKLLFWKKVWKKTWILDPKICTNPVLTSVPLTFESLWNSLICHTTGSNPVIDKYPTRRGGIKTSQLLNLSALHTRGTEWPSVRVVPLWFVLTLLQVFFLHLFLSRLSLVVERENYDRIVTLNDITHSLKSNSARKVRLRIRLLWYV